GWNRPLIRAGLTTEEEEELGRLLSNKLASVAPNVSGQPVSAVSRPRVAGLPKLITRKDIRGDLHTHTTESDGTASIEEMAAAAKTLGYEYLAITDHSKAMAMARGLTVDRLLKHIKNIHRISSKLKGITLLAG